MSNWKETMKQICTQINIINLRVCMLLRERKILQAHMKRKKSHRVVMFIYMNVANYPALQPLNACDQNKKQPSVR